MCCISKRGVRCLKMSTWSTSWSAYVNSRAHVLLTCSDPTAWQILSRYSGFKCFPAHTFWSFCIFHEADQELRMLWLHWLLESQVLAPYLQHPVLQTTLLVRSPRCPVSPNRWWRVCSFCAVICLLQMHLQAIQTASWLWLADLFLSKRSHYFEACVGNWLD